MKRYIRLKNNCIIDTTKHIGYEIDDELYGIGHIVFMKKDIIKESDNILDLIQVGDLVEVHYKESELYIL